MSADETEGFDGTPATLQFQLRHECDYELSTRSIGGLDFHISNDKSIVIANVSRPFVERGICQGGFAGGNAVERIRTEVNRDLTLTARTILPQTELIVAVYRIQGPQRDESCTSIIQNIVDLRSLRNIRLPVCEFYGPLHGTVCRNRDTPCPDTEYRHQFLLRQAGHIWS